MNRSFFIIFLVIVFSISAIAQEDLVRFSDLTFVSDFEKESFKQYFDGDMDITRLLQCINPRQTEKGHLENDQQLRSAIDKLKQAKLEKKKPNKKVRTIYTTIHDTFLDKYEKKNEFSEIFDTGKYNCVSATALFALVFEELSISYTIKELPTHVFLIAYPENEQILVETTDPLTGYIQFSQIFKRTYLENLRERKLIGSAEYSQYSSDDLFDKYYFDDEDISLEQLVGIQYINDGIYKLQEGNLEKALSQFEKGYLLYPSDKAAYLSVTTAIRHLTKLNLEDDNYTELVMKLSRYTNYGITGDHITGEFNKLTSAILYNKGDLARYEAIYYKFNAELEDENIKRETSFIFHYEAGRYYFNKGLITKALENIEQAYQLQPGNAQGESFLITAIRDKISRIDNAKLINYFLEGYFDKYSGLSKNPLFYSMLLDSYLLYSELQFRNEKANEGNDYLTRFEEGFKGKTDLSVNNKLIVRAYASASVYYFVKGYKSKSRTYLLRGLNYVPENIELKQRLQMLR